MMYSFPIVLILCSLAFIDGKQFNCIYSSREYQVVLNPEILSGTKTFSNGVNLVFDVLTTIENNGAIDFKVSRSSLKFNNVSVVKYFARDDDDLQFPIIMKSRQRKIYKPADFVLKISNPDPTLACTHLKLAKPYNDVTETKFELDFHACDGRILTKSGMSYSINHPNLIGFTKFTSVNLSDIFDDVAEKISRSGAKIVADPYGGGIQLTAEFTVRLNGQKFKGTILLLDIGQRRKAEFSFRIKGTDVDEDVLYVAQEVVKQVSLVQSILLHEGSSTVCED